jgi:hypothetical protein
LISGIKLPFFDTYGHVWAKVDNGEGGYNGTILSMYIPLAKVRDYLPFWI